MNRIETIGGPVAPGTTIGPGPTGYFDSMFPNLDLSVRCQAIGPTGPIKRRGDWCYRDDQCNPNRFHTVDCPGVLPVDLGNGRPGSDNTPSTGPRYGIVIAGLLIGGLWIIFGGRKN